MPTTAKKILKYSPQQMKDAITAVQRGTPVATAAKACQVPRVTLLYKIKGKYPQDCRMGPTTVLTSGEEDILVKWVLHIAEAGFPCTKVQLLDSVEMLMKELKRPNTFTNDRPGRKWYESFLKRHPEIAERVAQNLCKSRQTVTQSNIRKWFEEIKQYLESDNKADVLQDPMRIFNSDETAFFLCPKGSKVLVQKGEKSVYNFTNNDEKECLTTLVTANASGKLAPPMVVYSYKRIPASLANSMPSNWGIGRSDSGWMTGETFYEYVTNVFHSWILENNLTLPVLLFVDGHISHLTESLSNFCSKNGIILAALYPNSTHIIQPMDVSVFHPLKCAWKNGVHQWRLEHNGQRLKKEEFAPLLNKVIREAVTSTTIRNGFKACGLYPFNPDAVDYKRLMKGTKTSEQPNLPLKSTTESCKVAEHLNFLEQRIGVNKVEKFSKSDEIWRGDIEDKNLFLLWKSIKEENVQQHNETNQVPQESEITLSEEEQAVTSASISALDKGDHTSLDLLCPGPSTSKATPNKSSHEYSGGSYQDESTKTNCGQFLPSPFKKALFWPLQTSTPTRKTKVKIPSVATSNEWKKYHAKKREEKERVQREKDERKKKREENKKEKETKTGKVNRNRKVEISSEESSDSSVDVLLDSEGDGDDWSQDTPLPTFCPTSTLKIQVNDYVIVEYEGEFFPGLVLNTKPTEAYVKVMLMSGCGWKWPLVEDKLWYYSEDILEKIKPPKYDPKMQLYLVQEITKYRLK